MNTRILNTNSTDTRNGRHTLHTYTSESTSITNSHTPSGLVRPTYSPHMYLRVNVNHQFAHSQSSCTATNWPVESANPRHGSSGSLGRISYQLSHYSIYLYISRYESLTTILCRMRHENREIEKERVSSSARVRHQGEDGYCNYGVVIHIYCFLMLL